MDLPKFASHIQQLGLMDRPFADLSREEATALARAAWDCLEPTDARRLPYFRERPDGARELFIPFDAPARLPDGLRASLRHCLEDDGWLATYRILETLGASEAEKVRYLGTDWRERMRKRTLFNTDPRCPVCGNAVAQRAGGSTGPPVASDDISAIAPEAGH